MRRISSQMNNKDTQYNLRVQESRLNKIQNQLGTNQRLQSLRDDPIAAGHLVRFQSYVGRIESFEKNAYILSENFVLREGYMSNSLSVMQRVRELAVQGANGIYSRGDLRNMASEVDELLGELLQNANAIGPDGTFLFSGTRVNSKPFSAEMGAAPSSPYPVIAAVHYNGNIDSNKVEVDENKFLEIENAGNKTFWAEKQFLFGARDSLTWQALEDSVICVDGKNIQIEEGDNVYALVAKINDSGVAVKATIDPVTHGLNLSTTDSRQLWLEDFSGSALFDLGIIKEKNQMPPYNIADGVRVTGGSLFDAVIAFRDALLEGDSEAIGGRVLATLDSGIENLVTRVALGGSKYERAMNNAERNSKTILDVTSAISREGDTDITQAITDEKMLELTNQATLQQAGKMYSNSLLNYMR